MNNNLFKQVLVIALFVYLPVHSMAWGMLGHRIVGEVASTYVNAKAKKEIQAILGHETIAMASNWPDFIKSDSNYKYLNAWHYVDLEPHSTFQLLQDSLRADTSVNAFNRIEFLVSQLKNKSLTQSDKQMYLRLLIHVVGDVHQPFHVGRKGDRGGNDIKVSWFGDPTNMHKIWDEELIKYQELSYTEYANAINFTTANQRAEWQKQPLLEWFNESFQISEKLHDDVKPNEKLGYNYNFKNVGILNQQLLKGGVRLAGLLNEIFGS